MIGNLSQPLSDKKIIDGLEDNIGNVDEIFKDNDEYRIVSEFILNEPNFTEKSAIMMFLGFKGQFYSQKEIAQKLGYSRSYISQMISKMSKKIDEKLRKNNIKDKNGCYMTVSALKKFLKSQKGKLTNKKTTDSLGEEKNIFGKKNDDLDHYISDDCTSEDGEKYSELISNKEEQLEKIQSDKSNEKKETVLKENLTEENISSLINNLPKKEDNDSDNDIKMEHIYWPNLDIILERMPRQEAFIVSLSLGLFPNRKAYSVDEIANFLNIDRTQIIEIVKNTLLLYKQNFNNFIDELVNEDKTNKK